MGKKNSHRNNTAPGWTPIRDRKEGRLLAEQTHAYGIRQRKNELVEDFEKTVEELGG